MIDCSSIWNPPSPGLEVPREREGESAERWRQEERANRHLDSLVVECRVVQKRRVESQIETRPEGVQSLCLVDCLRARRRVEVEKVVSSTRTMEAEGRRGERKRTGLDFEVEGDEGED